MKALFFGSLERKLYGVYHPPLASTPLDAAVILCSPGVQEYVSAHWAFRKLAGLLARRGFHVLRFDWSGTGDSSGATEEASLDLWVDDVQVAAQEALDMSGAATLSVVGRRLGAALAARACAKHGLQVRDLVLWDPVICGREYIEELEERHASHCRQLLHPSRPAGARFTELLGHPFPLAMRRAIEGIDLRGTARLPAARTLIVSGEDRAACRDLERSIAATGGAARYCLAQEQGFQRPADPEAALLADRALAAIAAGVAEGTA